MGVPPASKGWNMHRWTPLTLPLLVGATIAAATAGAQPMPPPVRALHNPAPKEGEEFGFPLAVYGDDLLVAVAASDGGVQQHGRVLQMDLRSGAALRTFDRPRAAPASGAARAKGKLEPANSAVASLLNIEDKVLIGMPYDDAGKQKFTGAVHIFYSHDGALLRTLGVPARHKARAFDARDSRFGAALAHTDGALLVGAPGVAGLPVAGSRKGPARCGAVFQFELQSGALQQAYAKDDGREDDEFGAALATARGMVLVAAPGEAGGGTVYAYNPVGAVPIRSFRRASAMPTGGKASDGFALALATTERFLLVGAPGESTLRPRGGAVYVFDLTTGTLQRVLRPPATKADDLFGYSVVGLGAHALIGGHGVDRGAGAVFVLDPAGGDTLQTLRAPRPGVEHGFGMAMAPMGAKVAVSAHREPAGEVGTGVVYVMALDLPGAVTSPAR